MPTYNIIQAVNDALRLEMRRDNRVVVLGEDVGKFGGVFRATNGLFEEFGADRVFDTPLAGLCAPTCDPLLDNDFDGDGATLTRAGTACANVNDGCYGAPSYGTPPVTAFTCEIDPSYGIGSGGTSPSSSSGCRTIPPSAARPTSRPKTWRGL